MGSGMARNLLSGGHQVTVHNRNRKKAEPLAAAGAHVADSPADACRGAEAVVTMLRRRPGGGTGSARRERHRRLAAGPGDSRFVQHHRHRAGQASRRATRPARAGIRERSGLRPSGSRGEQEPPGGRRRQRANDGALPAAVRRHRAPDVCPGIRAVAGQCREAVREFHDREHDRGVRGVVRDFAEGGHRAAGVSGGHERAVRVADVCQLRAPDRRGAVRAGGVCFAAGPQGCPPVARYGRWVRGAHAVRQPDPRKFLAAMARGQGEMDWSSVCKVAARPARKDKAPG